MKLTPLVKISYETPGDVLSPHVPIDYSNTAVHLSVTLNA